MNSFYYEHPIVAHNYSILYKTEVFLDLRTKNPEKIFHNQFVSLFSLKIIIGKNPVYSNISMQAVPYSHDNTTKDMHPTIYLSNSSSIAKHFSFQSMPVIKFTDLTSTFGICAIVHV